MKFFLSLVALCLLLASPGAHANGEVPMDQDPMFAEMTGDNPASGDGADQGGDGFEGTLEQTAEHFNQTCFEGLGPMAACFEDYETPSCEQLRHSCRLSGHYSR